MKHWPTAVLARCLHDLPQTRADRLIAVLTGVTLLAGLLSAAALDGERARAEIAGAPCPVACAEHGAPGLRLPAPATTTARPGPSPSTPPRVASAPATPPPTRAVATPAPRLTPAPPRLTAQRRQPLRVPAGVAPATAVAINSMRLSAAGYRAFLAGIDQSYFDYAQRFVEFDPDRVPIEQGPSKVFVWHFTAFYRNADGPSQTQKGAMAIRPFVEGLAKRGDDDSPADHVCCGVNWVIDRHGPAHQLAPVNAKLRHNPPYDSINTGVEIEAGRQAEITTAQYETTAYLTIAVLDQQRLLGRKPLSQIAKGHGEMRDAYLEDNPHSHYGARNDFNEPESRMLRQAIEGFLRANPEVIRMTPRLR